MSDCRHNMWEHQDQRRPLQFKMTFSQSLFPLTCRNWTIGLHTLFIHQSSSRNKWKFVIVTCYQSQSRCLPDLSSLASSSFSKIYTVPNVSVRRHSDRLVLWHYSYYTLQTSLRLRRFKSDRVETMQDCSPSKYASIYRVGLYSSFCTGGLHCSINLLARDSIMQSAL